MKSVLCAFALCVMATTAVPADAPNWSRHPALHAAQGKVVLLDFWASWCGPCRKSFPWMNALQAKFGAQGLTVIAVNMDHDRALAEDFLRATPAHFQIEYDAAGALATELNVAAMPTSFLLDRRGRVVRQHAGFRDAQRAEREAEIAQLLEENSR